MPFVSAERAVPTPELDANKAHPLRLVAMSWTHFLNDGGAFFLPGILPAVIRHLHQPLYMVGPIVGSIYIGQILQPLFGIWADHIGGKFFVIAGLVLCVGTASLIGLSPNVWILIALVLLSGLGSTAFHPQALSAARSLSGKRHAQGMAVFLVGGELGRGVWPLLASLIVVHLGLPDLWLIAIPTVLTVPWLLSAVPSQATKPIGRGKISIRSHLKPFLMLVGFSAFRNFAVFGSIAFIPIMWHLRGGALVQGAGILSTLLVTGIIGQIAGGTAADKWGRRHELMISSVAMLLLLPILPHVEGAWLYVVAGLLGIACFSTYSSTLVIGQDIFPENRAMGSGIALGFSNAIGAIGLFPLGYAAAALGITSVFYILTCACVGMLLMSLTFSGDAHPSLN
ncbi:MAG: MFS transporter [Phycisphaerae bacterium]